MKQLARPLTLLATALTTLMLAVPAQAQMRVFVGAQGSDSNPCTFALPCRTFQHAHDTVAGGGEIDVLDPAGYGAVTIAKAISIQGHGFSGITAASGTAITINAGPSDKIGLSGLIIEGFARGASGIVFNTGGSLNIQDSKIRNFTSNGILFQPTAASKLNVSQTLVSDLGSSATAVLIQPTGTGTADATLDRVGLEGGGAGLAAVGGFTGGAVKVTIADSVIANYGSVGVEAVSSTGPTQLMVRNCTISSNATGIFSGFLPAAVRVTRSTITANGTGLSTDGGGTLISYGDNNVDGNTTANGSPTTTIGYH